MNIGIYIYKDVEVLDFAGPFEVFSTANRFLPDEDKWNVSLLSSSHGDVSARGGFNVQSDYSILSHPKLDVVVIPGGIHEPEMTNVKSMDWIAKVSKEADLVSSVCTGAFLLAQAGVITDQTVTTHWEDQGDLKAKFPNLTVKPDVRWVDLGRLVTSGGISAGIDMSLRLVEKLKGREIALKTAKQMEFDWNENGVIL
ncbi:DJ-1/PfpI family protein [Vibrio sp. SCSIO 43140]|uniref:DJ-1/PfpI family protein n=1 Tax=Vibrio sp. SCSIO 43140 TaxID=2819100 RepID=UPI00207653A1|nr:DJ-1/PfpI family protein [Vibrio sp. SCSIO 43140]USD61988.1 DJ-1/PfpI family protein [Vibrio sp. SCSIO 43140]